MARCSIKMDPRAVGRSWPALDRDFREVSERKAQAYTLRMHYVIDFLNVIAVAPTEKTWPRSVCTAGSRKITVLLSRIPATIQIIRDTEDSRTHHVLICRSLAW